MRQDYASINAETATRILVLSKLLSVASTLGKNFPNCEHLFL